MSKITLFAQVISKLDSASFKKLVFKHGSDKHQKGYDSWSHWCKPILGQDTAMAALQIFNLMNQRPINHLKNALS